MHNPLPEAAVRLLTRKSLMLLLTAQKHDPVIYYRERSGA